MSHDGNRTVIYIAMQVSYLQLDNMLWGIFCWLKGTTVQVAPCDVQAYSHKGRLFYSSVFVNKKKKNQKLNKLRWIYTTI